MAYLPRRFIVVFMLCVAMVILHAMRTNVAVAVLETINRASDYDTFNDENNTININDIDEKNDNNNKDLSAYNLWTMREVSYVHAAFYVGYVAFQIPAAWTTTKLPSNRMLCLAVFTSCTLNLVIPACFNGKQWDRIEKIGLLQSAIGWL